MTKQILAFACDLVDNESSSLLDFKGITTAPNKDSELARIMHTLYPTWISILFMWGSFQFYITSLSSN